MEAVLRDEAGHPSLAEVTVVPHRPPGWLRPPATAGIEAVHPHQRLPTSVGCRITTRWECPRPTVLARSPRSRWNGPARSLSWWWMVGLWPTDSGTGSRWKLDAVDLGLESGFEIRIVPCLDAADWVPEPRSDDGMGAQPISRSWIPCGSAPMAPGGCCAEPRRTFPPHTGLDVAQSSRASLPSVPTPRHQRLLLPGRRRSEGKG